MRGDIIVYKKIDTSREGTIGEMGAEESDLRPAKMTRGEIEEGTHNVVDGCVYPRGETGQFSDH